MSDSPKTVGLDFFVDKSFVLTAVEFGRRPLIDHYGADQASTCAFTLNGTTFLAMEDPDDGYRSSLSGIEVRPDLEPTNLLPPVKVIAKKVDDSEYETNNAIVFCRADNDLPILEIGTHNTSDYYPSYVAHFQVKNLPGNEGEKVAEREAAERELDERIAAQEHAERQAAGWGTF